MFHFSDTLAKEMESPSVFGIIRKYIKNKVVDFWAVFVLCQTQYKGSKTQAVSNFDTFWFSIFWSSVLLWCEQLICLVNLRLLNRNQLNLNYKIIFFYYVTEISNFFRFILPLYNQYGNYQVRCHLVILVSFFRGMFF